MNRTSLPRFAILTGFMIVVAVLVWGHFLSLERETSQVEVVQTPLPPTIPPEREVIQKARDRAQRHLDAADKLCKARIPAALQPLERFFQDAKKNSPHFAEEAMSWGSKWRLVGDFLPFADGDGHEKFLRAKFQEHLFAPEQLEAAVRQAIKGYLDELQSIENQMLVDIQVDMGDLPPVLSISSLDRPQLEAAYRQALQRAREHIASNLKADVGTEVVSLLAGEVLTHVAVRLGVSAGILGTGAASGWATLGVGLVVGLIVDQIVSWVWDWWADPRGELATELNRKLDELHHLIVEGDAEHPGLRQQLERCANARAQLRRHAVLDLIQHSGEPR